MKYIMRNLCKYIITSVTLVASAIFFGSVALAQSTSGMRINKMVSGPNEDGVFTLNLEAYATGSITVETKPADIVLILDKSGSMAYNMSGSQTSNVAAQNQRINILKNAVKEFVDNVNSTNETIKEEYKDAYGGHRIAFVWFSGEIDEDKSETETYWDWSGFIPQQRTRYTKIVSKDEIYDKIQGLNVFQNVENLTTSAASGNGNGYRSARVLLNGNNLLGVTADGGTKSDFGMRKAQEIFSSQDYSDKENRSRLVVFFTDGDPGMAGMWETNNENLTAYVDDTWNTADGCISAANDIKNSSDYSATVYSVGLFSKPSGTADRTTTYLSYTSSDFTDKTQMPRSGWIPVSNNKSILVSSAHDLYNIFSSISENTSNAASASSVLVDIVASNFRIPTTANLGSVKVWEVPCTQQTATSFISFPSKYGSDGTTLLWTDITNDPAITLDKTKQAQGEISVTGFDYGAKWCGWDASSGTAHGSKLVLEIPISVNDDIVGGPSLETNLPGSKITVKDSDNNIIEELEFISPVVKVPVTIWIKKEGLLSSTKNSAVQGHEDNAVFTIRKTRFHGLYETDEHGNEFEGGRRIDYTYTKGTTKTFKVNGVNTPIEWTTFTKVSVNMKEGAQDGIVKISGLDPDYIYRIEEDAWAHLGYDFDPDATARYTLEWNGTEYIEPTNPFVFSNTPKTNAFYSEDVVRNVFNPGSAAPTTTP